MTIRGKKGDNITGRGQTVAALALARQLPIRCRSS